MASLRQKVILTILGIFLTLVFLEIGLRLGAWSVLTLQEYRNKILIKQKGVYRIMCIGESTTFWGGDDSYPSQLERILNASQIGVKFSVVNAGLPASNSSWILSNLNGNIDKYKPAMVIAMMGVNDKDTYYNYSYSWRGKNFLRNFKIYKLAELLQLHVLARKNAIKTNVPKGSTVDDANSCMVKGDFYKHQGDYIRAQNLYEKAITLSGVKNTNTYSLYCSLAWFYNDIGNYIKAEDTFKKCLNLYADKDIAYIEFAEFYRVRCNYSRCEELIRKVINLNPANEDAYIKLGLLYVDQKKYDQAEEAFKEAINVIIKNKKENLESALISEKYGFYAKLAGLYTKIGRHEDANKLYEKANELMSNSYNPTTRNNYLKAREILDQRGIKLVCSQYPMRDIAAVKNIFKGQKNVIFVDNEIIFKKALKEGHYWDYFTDMFAGDFGHCTPRGNRLLAENIARSILKEYFNK